MIEIPRVVRNKAVAAGASWWLADLPELVALISEDWGLAIGQIFDDATEALVAEAVLDDGTSCVLKLIVPRDGSAALNEITVLRLADGDGCARLMRADESSGALLLERLGPSLHSLNLPLSQRLGILATAASRIWRPTPAAKLPSGADKGRWLIDFITTTWEELDHPCSEQAVDYALQCAGRRIENHDDERAVLVHGDVHEWNALRSDNGFKLVDPDGLLAEAEYDLGVLMREDPVELLHGDPHERARRLSAPFGLNAEAVWEWGVVERVSTGLLCTKVDLQPVGREMLRTADCVVP